MVIAPHADDEVLGCGGLLAKSTGARVVLVTLGASVANFTAQTDAEYREALATLGCEGTPALFPGMVGRLDTLPMCDLVAALDAQIDDFKPTAVFLPYASHHQDHAAVYRATLAALRPRANTVRLAMVALYEYPYSASWPPPELPGGKVHLPLDAATLATKMRALGAYRTQFARESWLTLPRAKSWARTRGAEIDAPAAEAFWVVRGLLGVE